MQVLDSAQLAGAEAARNCLGTEVRQLADELQHAQQQVVQAATHVS